MISTIIIVCIKSVQMCDLHVRMKLYRTACCFSDTHSHFFSNHSITFARILSNKYTIAQVYRGMNVRIGKKCIAGTLREFARNIIWNTVRKLSCNLLAPRSLNMKFGTRRKGGKLYRLQNGCEVAVWLQPIKSVLEQPIYYNRASLCSLCEVKESAKKIYILFLFVNYRIWKNMLLLVLLGLIANLALVLGDCNLGTATLHDFDWNRVGIFILTCLL